MLKAKSHPGNNVVNHQDAKKKNNNHGNGEDLYDRDYLKKNSSTEFFRNFLPSKSSQLIEKLIFVILKKFNQFGMRYDVIQALSANFSKSNSMNVDWARLICWVAAVRVLILNDPNPVKIQEFVQTYPYLIEYNLYSKERLYLQRFERAMFYLTKTDMPFDTERQLIFRICRYFEQCSVIDIDRVDNNRVAIYERYSAMIASSIFHSNSNTSLEQHLSQLRQSSTYQDTGTMLLNQHGFTKTSEVVHFPGSSLDSPESIHGLNGSIPMDVAPAQLPPPKTNQNKPQAKKKHWTKMTVREIGNNYDMILDDLSTVEEVDEFAGRLHPMIYK